MILRGAGLVNMKFLVICRRPGQLLCDLAVGSRHPHHRRPRGSASQPRRISSQLLHGRAPHIPTSLSNIEQLPLLTIFPCPSQRACIQPLQHSSCVSGTWLLTTDFKNQAPSSEEFKDLGFERLFMNSDRGPFLPAVSCRCAAAALQHQGKYELSTDTSKKPGWFFADHTRYAEPSKSHQHLQGRGFFMLLRKWKFRCAQCARCLAQLRFVHHISAGEDCIQAMPREAIENSFSENGFPHSCVSSFCSCSALNSGLKGNSGLHFGGLS